MQVTSVYSTAAAMLFGALLTVAVQVITSAMQRRHDRIARTFNIRLDLYAKTRRTISNWSIAYQATRQVQSELSTSIAKIGNLSSNKSDPTGAPSDQAVTMPQEIVEQHVKKIENNVSALAYYMQNLRAAQRELKEMSHSVALLANKPVDEALANLLEQMAGNTKQNKLDFDKFDRAARRELGVEVGEPRHN